MSTIENETVRSIVMGFMLNRTLSRVAEHWWAAHMWLIQDRQRSQSAEAQASIAEQPRVTLHRAS